MPDANDEGAGAAPGTVVDGARKCILAVDDDVLIAMSMTELLDDLGYDVIEATSVEIALETLRGDRPIDLLLTDYSMPGMNGVELAQAALQARPGLPILIATGYGELPSGQGMNLPLLGKPYREAELAQAIGQLIGR